MLPEMSWGPYLAPQKSHWTRGAGAAWNQGCSGSCCQWHWCFSSAPWLSVYHRPTYNSHFGPKISALLFSAAGQHFLRLWTSEGRTLCSWTEDQMSKGALILIGTSQLHYKWIFSDHASWWKWCFKVWHVIWKRYFSNMSHEIEKFVLILKKSW